MKLLIAPTEDYIRGEQSRLDSDASAGSGVALTLENNDGFSADLFIRVGYEGQETTELCEIDSISGNQGVTVATLKYDHPAGTPVQLFRFNKRKFYGSDALDGTYTELTDDGSPKDIQVDDPRGSVLEYTGNDYSYFKAIYYNSVTGQTTLLSEAEAAQVDESSRYVSLWDIRVTAGFAENSNITDSYIEKHRTAAEAEVRTVLAKKYSLPLSYIPDYVRDITELLAAGKMLYKQYPDSDAGEKMLGEARSMLKKIRTGDVELYDLDGVELTQVARASEAPKYGRTDDDTRVFTKDMRF